MSSTDTDSHLVNPVKSRLGYRLRRISSAMMADLGTALEDIGLRPVEATIVLLIDANPGCIQSDIGRTLGIKRANMVPLIAALADRALVRKSPVDGRSFALSLTTSGAQMSKRADAIIEAHEQRYDRLLTPEMGRALRNALDRFELEEGRRAAVEDIAAAS